VLRLLAKDRGGQLPEDTAHEERDYVTSRLGLAVRRASPGIDPCLGGWSRAGHPSMRRSYRCLAP